MGGRLLCVRVWAAVGAVVVWGALTVGPAQGQVAGVAPAHIDIPSIGTHADVFPLGEDDDGAMAAPGDPDTVGWFQMGVGIGAPGNALLDGHVDWGGRLRVFGLLKWLNVGDTFQISDKDGNVYTYEVAWSQLYDAETAPLDEIFDQTSDPEVTLITCGGEFDSSIHMYVSRWIVRAVQISAD